MLENMIDNKNHSFPLKTFVNIFIPTLSIHNFRTEGFSFFKIDSVWSNGPEQGYLCIPTFFYYQYIKYWL